MLKCLSMIYLLCCDLKKRYMDIWQSIAIVLMYISLTFFLLLLFLSFLLKFEKILPDIEIKETVLSYLSEGMENSLSCSNSFIICKSKQNVEKLSFWKCITIDGWVIWKLRNRWSICTYLITYFITLLYN